MDLQNKKSSESMWDCSVRSRTNVYSPTTSPTGPAFGCRGAVVVDGLYCHQHAGQCRGTYSDYCSSKQVTVHSFVLRDLGSASSCGQRIRVAASTASRNQATGVDRAARDTRSGKIRRLFSTVTEALTKGKSGLSFTV